MEKILPMNVGQGDLLGLSHRESGDLQEEEEGLKLDGHQPSLNSDQTLSRARTYNGSG